ncbi:MAG TPA: arginine repressor [Clostridia bacterium]|jgi:transcriptional regulator of arginine metabolism|nr:arginine repressor [Clostridia bacterium]
MSIREERHSKILRIIAEKEIDTQEQLVESLNSAGCNVTQATVSRDIKELGLIKVRGEHKKYKYALPPVNQGLTKLANLFSESVISMETAMNIIVCKTYPGTANTACVFLDKLGLPHIVGTLAGDDTFLIIAKTIEDVDVIYNKLKEYLRH